MLYFILYVHFKGVRSTYEMLLKKRKRKRGGRSEDRRDEERREREKKKREMIWRKKRQRETNGRRTGTQKKTPVSAKTTQISTNFKARLKPAANMSQTRRKQKTHRPRKPLK